MFAGVAERLEKKSAALSRRVETGLDRLMMAWLLAAGLACAARIATSPAQAAPDASTLAPYLLLILVPFASMVLALRWFAHGDSMPQPAPAFIELRRWRSLPHDEVVRHPLYGARGIMVSLLVGILLNVPVRATEFLASMPAISGPVPSWLWSVHVAMTIDVLVLTALYTIAFVAALQRVPLFPRLLVGIWILDLAMQLFIWQVVAMAPGVPADVAGAMRTLLGGNLQKVLISAAIWLPYLLLSKRVNVTYRRRMAA